VKFYSFKPDKTITGNTLFFIIDPAIKHPGLVDRFKAIVGCYFIAGQNGFDFKIIFETPFLLSDYLEVNQYNWIADRQALSYSLRNTRVIAYNGGGKIPRLKRSVKQYHVYSYIGYDILETNQIPAYRKRWGDLFNTLFKPQDFLLQRMGDTGFRKDAYNAVHIRFVNALEHFEKDHFNVLPDTQKESLIQRCLTCIRTIQAQNSDLPLLVFSDSLIFLNRVRELSLPVLDGPIGHISYHGGKEVVIKTFLDFYMIANARQIYVIQAPELYNSVYPCYAALIGYKDYHTVRV
jgi:hypothetical protein